MCGIKKIWLVLFIILVCIQFIQPARNISSRKLPTDITNSIAIPENVKVLLVKACYDCHSNNSYYPWYANVQPVGWILNNHIQKGKKDLNFSDFGSYTLRRQESKLKSIGDELKDGEMPLKSYLWMHKEARLSIAEKALIINWAEETKNRRSGNR